MEPGEGACNRGLVFEHFRHLAFRKEVKVNCSKKREEFHLKKKKKSILVIKLVKSHLICDFEEKKTHK